MTDPKPGRLDTTAAAAYSCRRCSLPHSDSRANFAAWSQPAKLRPVLEASSTSPPALAYANHVLRRLRRTTPTLSRSTAPGCAFFDYDNDGWMDVFILGGRRLEGVPPGASNRLYHNNRDGTFTDVTAKAGLDRRRLGLRSLRRRLQQRRLRRSLHHLLRPEPPLSQQRRRHFYRCHRESRPARFHALASARAARLSITTATDCSICSSPTTSRSIWRPRPSPRCKCPTATTRESR